VVAGAVAGAVPAGEEADVGLVVADVVAVVLEAVLVVGGDLGAADIGADAPRRLDLQPSLERAEAVAVQAAGGAGRLGRGAGRVRRA